MPAVGRHFLRDFAFVENVQLRSLFFSFVFFYLIVFFVILLDSVRVQPFCY